MAAKPIPSHNGPPAKGAASSNPPSPTLYVKNLPAKIRKPDARMALYMLFSTYGPVLDVVVMRTAKMREQAHVVFRDTQASTQALRALEGFDFFGKDLSIQYGTGRSDVFTKLEGAYRPSNVPNEAPAVTSVFTAPAVTATNTSAPPSAQGGAKPAAVGSNLKSTEASQGTKRRREDESDEDEAPMEEDDDVSMEASSDDD